MKVNCRILEGTNVFYSLNTEEPTKELQVHPHLVPSKLILLLNFRKMLVIF